MYLLSLRIIKLAAIERTVIFFYCLIQLFVDLDLATGFRLCAAPNKSVQYLRLA